MKAILIAVLLTLSFTAQAQNQVRSHSEDRVVTAEEMMARTMQERDAYENDIDRLKAQCKADGEMFVLKTMNYGRYAGYFDRPDMSSCHRYRAAKKLAKRKRTLK